MDCNNPAFPTYFEIREKELGNAAEYDLISFLQQ